MEVKEDRFIRLAEKRVNELLDKFRLVGNLADRRNYAYTDEQAKHILRAIEEEFRTLKIKFSASVEAKDKAFSLSQATRVSEISGKSGANSK